MQWQYSGYTVVLFAGAAVSAAVAVAAWRRRTLPGARIMAALMVIFCEWTITAGLEIAAVGQPAKVFLSQVSYLGFCATPPFFFLFVYEYARPERELALRTKLALFIIPFITVLMAATNDWHRLLWSSYTPAVRSGTNILVYSHGPYFWFSSAYFYALMIVAVGFLVWAVRRFPPAYRFQGACMIVAASLSPLGGLVYVLGWTGGLDITPLGLVVGVPIVGWDILQYKLFDLVPVARHALIETMGDGVLVIDERCRIADVNPAARGLMALGDAPHVGQAVASLPAPWPATIGQLCGKDKVSAEVVVGGEQPRHIDVRFAPLRDRRGCLTGHLMVARDVTERRRVEDELRASQQRQEMQLQENEVLQQQLQEQAVRDPLTELFNRRYLEVTLEREIARAAREGEALSVLMFDLDRFKQTNDTLGHAAGDAVLRSVAQVLAQRTRRGDIACRYGGDEFIVIMPGTPIHAACRRAEQLRIAMSTLSIPYHDTVLTTKASCGIAAFPEHSASGDELLRLSDRALYAAKAGDGDSVAVWGRRSVPSDWLVDEPAL